MIIVVPLQNTLWTKIRGSTYPYAAQRGSCQTRNKVFLSKGWLAPWRQIEGLGNRKEEFWLESGNAWRQRTAHAWVIACTYDAIRRVRSNPVAGFQPMLNQCRHQISNQVVELEISASEQLRGGVGGCRLGCVS